MDDRDSGQPGKKLFVDARLSLPSNVCASCKMALFGLTHGGHGYLETPPPRFVARIILSIGLVYDRD